MADMFVLPVHIEGDVAEGQDVTECLTDVRNGDVAVFSQKIISKQEGRIIQLDSVKPSDLALGIASAYCKDPRIVHLVLEESSLIVRMRNGILIVQTHSGIVCANAGIDESNVKLGYATLLPKNPDDSASRLRKCILKRTGKDVAVLISDTFGRAFRMGQTDCAIGSAGMAPISDYAGKCDKFGRTLRVTAIAVADQMCGAAELVCQKTSNSPIAIIRGFEFEKSRSGSERLLRPRAEDLFR